MTTQPAVFEQPDLRTKEDQGRGSSYQHPHTGERVPSVTTISGLIDKSSYLVPWSAKLAAEFAADNLPTLMNIPDPDAIAEFVKAGAERRRNAGRDLGSLAHNTIEALCRGQQIEVPEEVQHHVKSWQEFIARYVKRIVMMEFTVWSHAHAYAGTGDALFEFKDGRMVLVDYKTGSDVHADAALQLMGLASADVVITTDGEAPMPQIDGLGVLHLPAPVFTKTGKVSVRGKWSFREVPMRPQEWETFLALRRAYQWEKEESRGALGGKQTSPAVKS